MELASAFPCPPPLQTSGSFARGGRGIVQPRRGRFGQRCCTVHTRGHGAGSARAQPCHRTKHWRRLLACKRRVVLFPSSFPPAWRSEQRAEELPGSPGLAVPALAVCAVSTLFASRRAGGCSRARRSGYQQGSARISLGRCCARLTFNIRLPGSSPDTGFSVTCFL